MIQYRPNNFKSRNCFKIIEKECRFINLTYSFPIRPIDWEYSDEFNYRNPSVKQESPIIKKVPMTYLEELNAKFHAKDFVVNQSSVQRFIQSIDKKKKYG